LSCSWWMYEGPFDFWILHVLLALASYAIPALQHIYIYIYFFFFSLVAYDGFSLNGPLYHTERFGILSNITKDDWNLGEYWEIFRVSGITWEAILVSGSLNEMHLRVEAFWWDMLNEKLYFCKSVWMRKFGEKEEARSTYITYLKHFIIYVEKYTKLTKIPVYTNLTKMPP